MISPIRRWSRGATIPALCVALTSACASAATPQSPQPDAQQFGAQQPVRSTPTEFTGPPIRWGMVVHGGAGIIVREQMSPEQERDYRAAMTEALRIGYAVLREGGSSLDAVEATIRFMEDSPLFNAGRGSVFAADGSVRMDAAIMDGRTLRAGAVGDVTGVKNPITLARAVMDATPHVLLGGVGAEEFARARGIEIRPPEYFFTQRRWEQLQQQRSAAGQTGTVGAIALDRSGALAVATSTGGRTNKMPGRIGDTPLIGAGTYADARCSVSGTGIGEYFIRNVVAHDVCARAQHGGVSLAQAANQVVHQVMPLQAEDTGGVIALDSAGNVAMPFNTAGMYRGYVDDQGTIRVWLFRAE